MEKKRYILFFVGALAVCLFALGGCGDDDDPVAVATEAEVFAVVMASSGSGPMKAEGDPGQAFVSVGGVGEIPTCEINGSGMHLEPEFTIYGGSLGFWGGFEFGADNAVDLTVDLGDGKGVCGFSDVGPGPCDIVGSSTINVAYGVPNTVDWTASANADAYWYNGYMNMRYYDTDGLSHYVYGNLRGTTTETELTVNIADELDGQVVDMDYVDYISGNFYVQPMRGPLGPDDESNMTGPCMGFGLMIGEQLRWNLNEAGPMTPEQERELRFEELKELIRSLR